MARRLRTVSFMMTARQNMRANAWTLSVLCATAIIFSSPSISHAALVLSSLNTANTENFTGLGTSGTAFPVGGVPFVAFDNDATAAPITSMVSDSGGANSGGVRNVGVTGINAVTDRALGSLGSGSVVPAFGVNIQNNTGGAVGEFTISYRSELWRSGNNAVVEVWNFQYAVVGSEISVGNGAATWINFDALDMTELNPSLTDNVAKDGNASGNFATIAANLSATVNQGEYLVFRWVDADNTGSDAIMAIDDFSITAVPEPANIALGIFATGLIAFSGIRAWRASQKKLKH